MSTEQFNKTIAAFDAANAADPNQEIWEGKSYPKELLYAQRMTERLTQFAPDASEALQLAARCQHICRWEIPRADYPMDRKGYHAWRNQLKKFHAEKAGGILAEHGYDPVLIEEVQQLLLKRQLKRNPATQTLEDVICLVFLEFYLEAFSTHYAEEKLISILQKTWGKMSEQGQQTALTLPLSDEMLQLVGKALA
ncbi:MAG: DUF4202 domain-containing protein [Bacteroidota bacterium]